MKKHLLLSSFVFLGFTSELLAQLPAAAQMLYDSAVVRDPLMVQYALNNGAQVIATPDGNSFYLQWFPLASPPATTPLVVSLHGSDGYAFYEFFNWHQHAQQHGCGIIALQWYRTSMNNPDYFDDTTIYNYLDAALTAINYPSGKALLHGFSRGAARSYAINFYDIQSGNNYFCTTISNSGSAMPGYPLYNDINLGLYGNNVFLGKHWNLFCGGQDPNPTQSGCIGMADTQTWLLGQGATVDIFIQDPALGHDGFQTQASGAYKDSILDNYLNCYAGTLAVNGKSINSEMEIFPNPTVDKFVVKFGNFPTAKAQLEIYDIFGKLILEQEINSKQTEIDFSNSSSGIYLVKVIAMSGEVKMRKLIVE